MKCIECQNRICEECEKLSEVRAIKSKSDHYAVIFGCLAFELIGIVAIYIIKIMGVKL